jgi:hypothetical protein
MFNPLISFEGVDAANKNARREKSNNLIKYIFAKTFK